MIVTVTLNPAVDKTCYINHLNVGKVNRLTKTSRVAGGKGVNVTKLLMQFGREVVALGFFAGENGRFIERVLQEAGAKCDFTYVMGETRVSTNIVTVDEAVTEILEPGPVVTKEDLERFLVKYEEWISKAKIVVLSGSLPQGVPTDIYAKLIGMAKQKGCKTFLDTSGEALRYGLEAIPYFIKPNGKELSDYVGTALKGKEDVADRAIQLCEKGIEKVVVTLGEEGLVAVTQGDVIYHDVYPVEVVNTVGCGDTVVASYVMSELQGDDGKAAAKKASALAAANAANAENGHFSMETYEKLLNS